MNKNTSPKVGLLNFHFANNYGAVLVAYSLKKTVESLGYRTEIINYVAQKAFGVGAFLHFRGKYLAPMSKEYTQKMALQADCNKWDYIIVGSDQVWRMFKTDIYMLSWASGSCSLISYAASFGHDAYDGSLSRSMAYTLLKRFDAISVRENSGVDICKNDFSINAVQVLDPTFLLSPSEYDEIIQGEKVRLPKVPYICGVFLSAKAKEFHSNKSYMKSLREKYPIIDPIRDESGKMRPVAEWLALIKNATYVITNSFHGAVFSIFFNKQFIPVMHEGFNGNARIPSLLSMFGIDTSRIVSSLDDITIESFEKKIDYEEVNHRLVELKKRSLNFLKNSLKNTPQYKDPWKPVDHRKAFNSFSLNKAEGIDDDDWAFYKKWVELKLAEPLAFPERFLNLEKRIRDLEEKIEKYKNANNSVKHKNLLHKIKSFFNKKK